MQHKQDHPHNSAAKNPWQWKMAALSAVVEHSDAIVVVKDLDLRLVAANAAFARVAGKDSVDTLIGKTDAEIFGVSPDTEPVRTYMADERAAQRLPAGEVIVREEPVMAHDGSTRYYLTKKHPIFDAQGELLGTGNISVDITERHQLEDRLRAANETLTKAVARAEAAAEVESGFLARMSHEIRTPMNGVLGLAELALRRPLDETTRQYLQELHQSGEQLLGILNDILDQSKIDSGELSLESIPFDREALFESERSLFAPMAQSKGLQLISSCDPDVPRWLIGDPLRLRQVLSNLLSNAIKFTEHGTISLCLQCLEQSDQQVRLRWSVGDTGIGMDQDTQSRLFQPFTQGDNSIARRFGGTGLGLSISRHLVERMGGWLEIESTPGIGSRFSFEISLPPAQAPSELFVADSPATRAAKAAADLNLRGRRILVVEDQPINRRIIHDMLGLFGAEVTLANNGHEALQCLAEGDFELVLMDIQMPEMDGLSATEHLRNNPAWAKLPVIALTAGVTNTERERVRTAGLNDLLAKPLRLHDLKNILGRWLPPKATAASSASSSASPSGPSPSSSPPEPPVITTASSSSPNIDHEHLYALLGDQQECNELLQTFSQSVIDTPEAITAALSDENPTEARALAHRLRGVSANVGANRLSAAAKQLEQALDAGQTNCDELLAALHTAHEHTLAEINQISGESPPAQDSCAPSLST
ncbi:ATP-binding protein [Rhabdochromatium marinum]|uniref:ATP-binding protein n=1 Tax=Rhabdochromatium marinum TaxID=48729 RepID=UPI0019072C9A|nr:ATP-binding protein [Rhabdochromatium marinum]